MSEPHRVLIVEDDFLVAEYLRSLCEEFGFPVVGKASDASTALELFEELQPDCLLMDVRLQGTADGVDLSLAIHAARPQTRIIFITGSNEPATMKRIADDHPFEILVKPINPEDLRAALNR